jgi:UDP-glucose 4-epimerase
MTNILVVGGAGYIGSHTCLELTPVVFDNLVNGHREFVQWGPFEQGDVRDENELTRSYPPTDPRQSFISVV